MADIVVCTNPPPESCSDAGCPVHGDPDSFPPEPHNPEDDTGMIMVSREDVRAVIRLARMSRHLAEDPATDRLAALCGPGLPDPGEVAW